MNAYDPSHTRLRSEGHAISPSRAASVSSGCSKALDPLRGIVQYINHRLQHEKQSTAFLLCHLNRVVRIVGRFHDRFDHVPENGGLLRDLSRRGTLEKPSVHTFKTR